MENELQDRYNPKSIWAYMWFSRKRYVRCPKCEAAVSKEEKICPKCGFKIHEKNRREITIIPSNTRR